MKKNTNLLLQKLKYLQDVKWMNVVHLVGIVTIALLLSHFTIYNIASLSVFAPLDKEVDFQMSDMYNIVASKKLEVPFAKDVVVVNIDNCSRRELVDAINRVSQYSPKGIGLDVDFKYPEEDNTYLLRTITQTPNLVGVGYVVRDDDSHFYFQEHNSFFEPEFQTPYVGYCNLNVNDVQHVVRTFRPFVYGAQNDTLYSLAYMLAQISFPDKIKKLLSRSETEVTIDYTSFVVRVISSKDISKYEDKLRDKVVLFGSVDDLSDAFLTPTHEMMAGVLIHAYILQTILSEGYIDSTTSGLNWLMAIIICVIYAIMSLWSKFRMNNYGNLFLRIFQFTLIFLLIYIGCVIFKYSHIYIDFAPGVLMLGLGALAFDLWFGAYALYEKLRK